MYFIIVVLILLHCDDSPGGPLWLPLLAHPDGYPQWPIVVPPTDQL